MKKKADRPGPANRGVPPWIITVLSILFVLLVGTAAWYQLNSYEQGILDVYANQQDGYVQLVLEQIRLTEKRGGTEAQIEEILGTLDASTNRYWTLSRQSSLIFVKDVMETNRYQGFTTASYYQTVSAQDFVSTLELDRVTHSSIQIDEHPYIASGARFTFQGESYRVCLLTNADTILDHNAYLAAKINLVTLALIALIAFVLAIEALSYLAGKYRKLYFSEFDTSRSLRAQTERLNQALRKDELYDSHRIAYTAKALPMLWEKLEDKDPYPLSFLILRCTDREAQQQFLRFTQFQKDAKVLRAFLDDTHILLVLIRVEELGKSAIMEDSVLPGVALAGELTLAEHPQETLAQCFDSFLERTLEDEKQAAL